MLSISLVSETFLARKGSHWRCFVKKGVPKNFFKMANLLKRLQHRCFPVNITKFLRTSINSCFHVETSQFITKTTGGKVLLGMGTFNHNLVAKAVRVL